MRIFLTGATGFIGSALVPELIGAGHQVLGLTRSDAGAQALRAAGAEPHHGDLEDLDSLRGGAAKADAVIHAAFNHDFSKFEANCALDRRAITALGEVLAGSKRPLLITSGTAIANTVPGKLSTEADPADPNHPNPRVASELAGIAMARAGVNVSVMRLPQVHDPVKQGLITFAVEMARQKGVSAYLGDGSARWPAAHVSDVARLYRLAIERQEAGAIYHAVAEEGVRFRDIAQVVGRSLKLPVTSLPVDKAAEHFGWLAMFASFDMPASGARTQAMLGWHPTGPDLLSDLARMPVAVA